MSNDYKLDFIKQELFEEHISNTLMQYKEVLKSIDLNKFNSNLIDPIKLLFDKTVFNKSFEDIIKLEIQRQRDKSNNNIIGYFHQNMFKYIGNCTVPKEGWDVIFKGANETYYVEMKNKHNTMNSSSASKTFMKMQNHLLNASNKNTSICALVEIISKKSQNIPWVITLDKQKQCSNKRLRRISIDKFYEIVTGNPLSFFNLCEQLPISINKIIKENNKLIVAKDTVFEELSVLNPNILLSLYRLAFSTYEGFSL